MLSVRGGEWRRDTRGNESAGEDVCVDVPVGTIDFGVALLLGADGVLSISMGVPC